MRQLNQVRKKKSIKEKILYKPMRKSFYRIVAALEAEAESILMQAKLKFNCRHPCRISFLHLLSSISHHYKLCKIRSLSLAP